MREFAAACASRISRRSMHRVFGTGEHPGRSPVPGSFAVRAQILESFPVPRSQNSRFAGIISRFASAGNFWRKLLIRRDAYRPVRWSLRAVLQSGKIGLTNLVDVAGFASCAALRSRAGARCVVRSPNRRLKQPPAAVHPRGRRPGPGGRRDRDCVSRSGRQGRYRRPDREVSATHSPRSRCIPSASSLTPRS